MQLTELLGAQIAVVYISATLLVLLFGAIILRAVVAGVTWSCAGRCIWLLPNMLSDVRSPR